MELDVEVREVVKGLFGCVYSANKEDRVTAMHELKEILFYSHPEVVSEYIEPLFLMQSSLNTDVKLVFFSFLEELCRLELDEHLPQIVQSVYQIIKSTDSVVLRKKAIVTMIQVHRMAIRCITKMDQTQEATDRNRDLWAIIELIRNDIIAYFNDSEYDPYKVQVIKFIESIILAYSIPSSTDELKTKTQPAADALSSTLNKEFNDRPENTNYVSLVLNINSVSDMHPFLRRDELIELSTRLCKSLIKSFLINISSYRPAWVLVLVPTLVNIAKSRSKQFFHPILTFFTQKIPELVKNTPASHQANTKKLLKMQYMAFLKHKLVNQPQSIKDISTNLILLGMKKIEIDRIIATKKKYISASSPAVATILKSKLHIDDINIELAYLKERAEVVGLLKVCPPAMLVNIVQNYMTRIPINLPFQFSGFGTADMEYQQALKAGIEQPAKNIEDTISKHEMNNNNNNNMIDSDSESDYDNGESYLKNELANDSTSRLTDRIEILPLTDQMKKEQLEMAYKRILISQQEVSTRFSSYNWGFALSRLTILLIAENNNNSTIKVEEQEDYNQQLPSDKKSFFNYLESLIAYIIEDLSARQDLAFSWLYHLYNELISPVFSDGSVISYESCFIRIFQEARKTLCSLVINADPISTKALVNDQMPHDKEYSAMDNDGVNTEKEALPSLYTRILLESPSIPDETFALIRQDCEDAETAKGAIIALRDMVMLRPKYKSKAMQVLIEYTQVENEDIRVDAVSVAYQLYSNVPSLGEYIEEQAISVMKQVLQFNKESVPSLSPVLLNNDPLKGIKLEGEDVTLLPNIEITTEGDISQLLGDEKVWNACNFLFMLCTKKFTLIMHVITIFSQSTNHEVHRSIVRLIDKAIDADAVTNDDIFFLFNSPLLTAIINNESIKLFLKIIHVISENSSLTNQAHSIVRTFIDNSITTIEDNEYMRTSILLFLIPLIKNEPFEAVLTDLGLLLTLNESQLREAMDRIFKYHLSQELLSENPDKVFTNAANLMVALHAPADLTPQIILAHNYLFENAFLYTQRNLTNILHKISNSTTIPQLFMRTILLSIKLHPDMIPSMVQSIMPPIMHRSNIWTDQLLLKGLVRIIEQLKPMSCQLLYSLDVPQLTHFFSTTTIRNEFIAFLSSQPRHIQNQYSPDLKQFLHKITTSVAIEKT